MKAMEPLTHAQTIGRLALSAVLSGVIGLERAWRGKSAGLRTHLLVGMGSTLFMLVSIWETGIATGPTPVDVTRIASTVVTGLGFLGAGMIFRSGTDVHGLTTAATLWAIGAMGLAVGAGYYSGAVYAWIGMGVALHLLDRVERFIVGVRSPEAAPGRRRRRA